MKYLKHFLYLIIILSFTYCSKKDSDNQAVDVFPKTFVFQYTDPFGDINIYDTLGNNLSKQSQYIPNDFFFSDGNRYPYRKIVINSDHTVCFYYVSHELTKIDNGFVEINNNVYHFSSTYSTTSTPLFDGVFKDDELIIAAYGCKYIEHYINGSSSISNTSFGTPEVDNLLQLYSSFSHDELQVQKYNLIYK